MPQWDPSRYLAFADERGVPFADLLSRVGAERPTRVVDLGCGPGQLTRSLVDRWPDAEVLGVDSSAAMIERARADHGDSASALRFEVADLRDWEPDPDVDVLITNATLQWVPEHRSLLPRLVAKVAPGGWFALQVPGNFDQPSHGLLHELAADPRFAAFTADVERPSAASAAEYLDDLSALDCRVEAWETTYLHLLTGPDPVFDWISGTGARPVLQALPEDLRDIFVTEYKAQLRSAYPARSYGTVLPFRRVFAVARRG